MPRRVPSLLVLALVIVGALLTTGTPAVAAPTPPADAASLTSALRDQLAQRRAAAGRRPLYERASYASYARASAASILDVGFLPRGPADAAVSHREGVAAADAVSAAVVTAAQQAAGDLASRLSLDLTTDGGWAVALRPGSNGTRWAVVALVGAPAAPLSLTGSKCSIAGFCWTYGGLHPHTPWTENVLHWHVSSTAPAAADSLLGSAIARLNAITGTGAQHAYAGRTNVADVGTGGVHFLLRWAATCPGSGTLACTRTLTTGEGQLVHGARIDVVPSKHASSAADRELWVSTLVHEVLHVMGLGHFDGIVAGTRQLMSTNVTGTVLRAGDLAGLRAAAPPGRLGGRFQAPTAPVRSGQVARFGVQAWNLGLGGLREVRLDCTDARGVWRTVARRGGTYSGTATAFPLSFTVPAQPARVSSCHGVITSHGNRTTTWTIPVTLGG